MTLALLNDHMAHPSNSIWLQVVLIVGALIVVASLIVVVWRVAAKLGSRVPSPQPTPASTVEKDARTR